MTSGIDPWADVREQIEDKHDTRRANLNAKRLLTDADALLVVVRAAEYLSPIWKHEDVDKALAALPPHLRGSDGQ